jgi:hypothetical protein
MLALYMLFVTLLFVFAWWAMISDFLITKQLLQLQHVTCCRSFATHTVSVRYRNANCYIFQVGSCDVKFPIRLEGLVLTHSQAAPQTFILYLAFICPSKTEIH